MIFSLGGDCISTSDPQHKTDGSHRRSRPKGSKKGNGSFVLTMVVVSFSLSVLFSYGSSAALGDANIFLTLGVLCFFVLLGVLFDIIGVATTSANLKTFNSMASRKVKGAREGIWLIKNAEKVSSFCNDVIGDICGIMSGTTGALITNEIIAATHWHPSVIPLAVTGVIAAATIGGKALGKTIAVRSSDSVVHMAGRVLYFFKKIVGRGD